MAAVQAHPGRGKGGSWEPAWLVLANPLQPLGCLLGFEWVQKRQDIFWGFSTWWALASPLPWRSLTSHCPPSGSCLTVLTGVLPRPEKGLVQTRGSHT